MENQKESPATQIIKKIMWEQGHQMGRSNIRVAHCGKDAVRLCVMYGIKFHIDDFSTSLLATEDLYAIACGCQRENYNKSAALSIEKAWDRKPFLLRDPDVKTPTRVYDGRWFKWFGDLYLKCSSFNDEKKYFNAALYKNGRLSRYGERPVKLLKINHEEIRLYHKYLDNKLTEKETAEIRKKYVPLWKLIELSQKVVR